MKNRTLLLKLIPIAIVMAFILPPVQAAQPGDFTSTSLPEQNNDKTALSKAICPTGASCVVSGYSYSDSLLSLLFSPSYKQSVSMAGGYILQTILTPADSNTLSAESPISKSVLDLISNTGNIADKFLQQTPQIFSPKLVLIPGAQGQGQIKIPFIPSFKFQPPPSAADIQNALNTLSLDSLVTPVAYQQTPLGKQTIDQKADAYAFIQYVTNLADPMPTADFDNMKMPDKYTSKTAYLQEVLLNKPEVKSYLTGLRFYTAQISVALSNFYYLYNERMPITDPKAQQQAAAIAPQLAKAGPISPLQIQQFLATRRVSDPAWYTAMQNALPSTLLRESLFLLAEMPPMLFQLHIDLERLLATMSAMQVQIANNNRLMLEQSRDKVSSILSSPDESSDEATKSAQDAQDEADQEQMKAAAEATKQQ